MKKLFIIISLTTAVLVSCNDNKKSEPATVIHDSIQTVDKDSVVKNTNGTEAISKDSILLKLTDEILHAFKSENYAAIPNYIDPFSGTRFSPYAYVDTIKNVVISKKEFIEQISKREKILWGEFDGSGEPIRMTLNEYIKRFVYDVDFAKPEKRSINDFIGAGNSLNNLLSVYKNADFTESYFSGFNKKYEGMDWKTLRLVFRKRDGQYFLIGVVHDEWTS